jgi:hypothetical protein
MKRPLVTEDRSDAQFPPGVFVPMAINLWDGSNGEHGLTMAISTWHYVFVEAPTPARVYGYSAFAVLAIGLVGLGLMRKVQKENET